MATRLSSPELDGTEEGGSVGVASADALAWAASCGVITSGASDGGV